MIRSPSSGPLRTSPRQAIVVDASTIVASHVLGPDRSTVSLSDEFRRAVFLDLLGSLVAVNGATISVLAAGESHAHALTTILPPGIDLALVPGEIERGAHLSWAIQDQLERAFSRVVVVAADIAVLPARTVATALSTLSTADLVLGPTPGGNLYLAGVRDQRGLAVFVEAGSAAKLDGISIEALLVAARGQEATVRTVERRRRLADGGGLEALRESVAATSGAAPRTAALLRTMDSDRASAALVACGGGARRSVAC
jgi:2-phospho-L-lactate guanylyltransferase (CobY/MobA/RfbA family)